MGSAQFIGESEIMPDNSYIMMYLSKSVFLIENIILLYIFLKPRRNKVVQISVFVITLMMANVLSHMLLKFNINPFIVSYMAGFIYIIPCIYIFKETIQAKFFVFFMIYSLTQFTFLVFMYIDKFLSPAVPNSYVLAGMLLELLSLPLFYHYARAPIRVLLKIINIQNPVFTIFPLLSFLLLAVYGLFDSYQLSTLISLVLSTLLIFFSYYLTASSLTGAKGVIKLEMDSITDNLTGLYNRRFMENMIEREYQQFIKNGSIFALVSADINFFNNISNRFGNDAGDSALKEIANVILNSAGMNDTVARWDEKEFFLLLPDTDEKQAMELSEIIRKKVEMGRFIPDDNSFTMSLTIGVSVVRTSDTVHSLIQRSDVAQLNKKHKSLNSVISLNQIESI